jgi:hypothetical protein
MPTSDTARYYADDAIDNSYDAHLHMQALTIRAPFRNLSRWRKTDDVLAKALPSSSDFALTPM